MRNATDFPEPDIPLTMTMRIEIPFLLLREINCCGYADGYWRDDLTAFLYAF